MPWVGIGISINWWVRRAFGMITPEPLGSPRNLAYSEDATAVTFTWDPPTSFGQAGPSATNRFGYRIRTGIMGGTLSPWTGVARLNVGTVAINWTSSTQIEIIQIEVFAYDGNDVQSAGTRSPVLTETTISYPPPRTLSFIQRRGNAFAPVVANWLAPERAGIVPLSGYSYRYRSKATVDSWPQVRMGYTVPSATQTALTAVFYPWLDDDNIEEFQFQVRAVYSDGGLSRWLDSGGVIMEGTVPLEPLMGGRFAGRFSGRFG